MRNVLRAVAALCFVCLAEVAVAGPVLFRLSGTVVQADPGTLASVGSDVSGMVKLSDTAPVEPAEFALGNGDVLDLHVKFGSYVWDLSRSSVSLTYFEGFMSPDKQHLDQYSFGMLENFFGVISNEFCLSNQVCQLFGGTGTVAMFDGRGFSVAQIQWTRIPEPGSLPLVALALVPLIALDRRRPR